MTVQGVRESTLKKIEKAIDEMYQENPGGFKLVLSEVHRRSGVSRPILGKPAVREHMDGYVARLPRAYAMISEQQASEKADNRRLREANDKLRKENRALLAQFNKLFDRIYGDALDVGRLLADREEGDEARTG